MTYRSPLLEKPTAAEETKTSKCASSSAAFAEHGCHQDELHAQQLTSCCTGGNTTKNAAASNYTSTAMLPSSRCSSPDESGSLAVVVPSGNKPLCSTTGVVQPPQVVTAHQHHHAGATATPSSSSTASKRRPSWRNFRPQPSKDKHHHHHHHHHHIIHTTNNAVLTSSGSSNSLGSCDRISGTSGGDRGELSIQEDGDNVISHSNNISSSTYPSPCDNSENHSCSLHYHSAAEENSDSVSTKSYSLQQVEETAIESESDISDSEFYYHPDESARKTDLKALAFIVLTTSSFIVLTAVFAFGIVIPLTISLSSLVFSLLFSNESVLSTGARVWAGVFVAGFSFFLWYSHKLFVHSVNMAGNPARLEDPSLIWAVRHFFGPARSRIMKFITEIELPPSWRAPIYQLFGQIYDVKMEECRYPLETYTCFQQFFTRSVKDDVHKIDRNCGITSPVDGRLVAMGEITGSEARVPQVKGASYDVTAFLGTDPYRTILEREMLLTGIGGKNGEEAIGEFHQELHGGVRLHKLEVQETRENVDELLLEEEKQFKRQRVIRQTPPKYNFTKEQVENNEIEFKKFEQDDLAERQTDEKSLTTMPGTNVKVSHREKQWASMSQAAAVQHVKNSKQLHLTGPPGSASATSTLGGQKNPSPANSAASTTTGSEDSSEPVSTLESSSLDSSSSEEDHAGTTASLRQRRNSSFSPVKRKRDEVGDNVSIAASSTSSSTAATTSRSTAFFNNPKDEQFHKEMFQQKEQEILEEKQREQQLRKEQEFFQKQMENKVDSGVKLAYCVLYLAPGDYHRFHSPVENFRIDVGRHYPGELFPVNPQFADWIPDLFTCNERLVLSGCYPRPETSTSSSAQTSKVEPHMRTSNKKTSSELLSMHMTAVAAYNVGGIWLDFDENLRTNDGVGAPFEISNMVTSKEFSSRWGSWEKILQLNKGDLVGGFRMGSTVVLVFECPKEYEWKVQEGDKIRMGEALMG
ncbi:unnamed protein product [Amoebophrya sp. A120]|nr:unnamed protein product [Amoebophrya sp. A120]|eukprot:GSA120T00009081001.1